MTICQVNITTKVNQKSIERVQHNGRPHWKISSSTLPFDVVMNGGLYPRSEIESNYKTLEGTLAPLGHPTVNGKFVSAFSPEGINLGHVGAWNGEARIEGNRVRIDKMIDIEVARRTERGRLLLERLEAIERGEGDPISTSVAAFLEQIEANESQRAMGAEWVAKISNFDHDAILMDEEPAASVEQGVGLMVNADQAKPLAVNAGALVGESYRDKERRIDEAARSQLRGTSEWIFVADFTDSQAVVITEEGSNIHDYTIEDGKIKFNTTGAAVVRQESWVSVAANKLRQILNPQARPVTNQKEATEMALTPEEKAELVKEIGESVAESMKPLSDAITQLQANHAEVVEKLEANAKQQDAEKRAAVAAVHGDIVANALSGEALDAMHKSLGGTVEIAPNHAGGPKVDEPIDYEKHFGGA